LSKGRPGVPEDLRARSAIGGTAGGVLVWYAKVVRARHSDAVK
jgi:hypothetical protein